MKLILCITSGLVGLRIELLFLSRVHHTYCSQKKKCPYKMTYRVSLNLNIHLHIFSMVEKLMVDEKVLNSGFKIFTS